MSTVDIVVLALAAVAIIGGALFALRTGKKGPSGPKTGGQVTGGGVETPKSPAAE